MRRATFFSCWTLSIIFECKDSFKHSNSPHLPLLLFVMCGSGTYFKWASWAVISVPVFGNAWKDSLILPFIFGIGGSGSQDVERVWAMQQTQLEFESLLCFLLTSWVWERISAFWNSVSPSTKSDRQYPLTSPESCDGLPPSLVFANWNARWPQGRFFPWIHLLLTLSETVLPSVGETSFPTAACTRPSLWHSDLSWLSYLLPAFLYMWQPWAIGIMWLFQNLCGQSCIEWDKVLDYFVQVMLPNIRSYVPDILFWDTLKDALEQT